MSQGLIMTQHSAPSLRSIDTRHKLAAHLKQFTSIRWRTIFVFVCLGLVEGQSFSCDTQGKPCHHPCIFILIKVESFNLPLSACF
jgi:hypothetical protein